MILQSLVRHYEILAEDENSGISLTGYSKAKISFALSLSSCGELLQVIPLKIREQRGAKLAEVPQMMDVPEQEKKTVGIKSNFLCENAEYMLGIDCKGNPARAQQCFEACRTRHHQILDGVDSEAARAVLAFFDTWSVENAPAYPQLQDYFKEICAGANLVFQLEGKGYIHKDPSIRRAWDAVKSGGGEEKTGGICLVSGERRPVARLHPSLKGVRGAQSAGASLVSFNASAYESYGKDGMQGLNAPVSEYATFAYTTMLNALLADAAHRLFLGDTTVVFWADSPSSIYADALLLFADPPEKPDADQSEQSRTNDEAAAQIVRAVFEKISQGLPACGYDETINPATQCCILGLAPNAARISVRFFMTNSFGGFVERISEHYKDLQIDHAPFEPSHFSLWRLLNQTVPPKSTDKASSPLLSGAVLRSILSGAEYPSALYFAVITRIRAEKEINYYKAAIIKAYLLRKHRQNTTIKEVLSVALNERSDNKAYTLGRLFSVLEKAQQDANPGINATIKDRYFTSACATPAAVFPVLLRLSQHHVSKSEFGFVSDRKIEELTDKLNADDRPFPSHLSLDDQGLFILGYYQQRRANYQKNNKEEKDHE